MHSHLSAQTCSAGIRLSKSTIPVTRYHGKSQSSHALPSINPKPWQTIPSNSKCCLSCVLCLKYRTNIRNRLSRLQYRRQHPQRRPQQLQQQQLHRIRLPLPRRRTIYHPLQQQIQHHTLHQNLLFYHTQCPPRFKSKALPVLLLLFPSERRGVRPPKGLKCPAPLLRAVCKGC